MSETDTWRRACASTICDKYPDSLHRFVRLSLFLFFVDFSIDAALAALRRSQLRAKSRFRIPDGFKFQESRRVAPMSTERGAPLNDSCILGGSAFLACNGEVITVDESHSGMYVCFCLTSKMRHEGRWRGSGVSQNRDSYRSCLHRMVRPNYYSGNVSKPGHGV